MLTWNRILLRRKFAIRLVQGQPSIADASRSGKTLTIEAKGNFTKRVEQGAYIQLTVKYGLIRLISQRADLCEQMKNAVDEECPLVGEKTITKDVDLPKEIPPVSQSFLYIVPGLC